MRFSFLAVLLALGATPAALGQSGGQGQVNVYNWSDYIDPVQLKDFSKRTGTKVNYTTYDSNEILDAKLKSGQADTTSWCPLPRSFFLCARSRPSSTCRSTSRGSGITAISIPTRWRCWPGTIRTMRMASRGCKGTIGIGYNATRFASA